MDSEEIVKHHTAHPITETGGGRFDGGELEYITVTAVLMLKEQKYCGHDIFTPLMYEAEVTQRSATNL